MPHDVYVSEYSIPKALMRSAWLWAQDRCKDPRTKVGAVVYDPASKASFYGYNGFNEGQPDHKHLWDSRDRTNPPTKYDFVRHAEANAIEKAMRCIGNLSECILVCTHLPCPACMKDWIVPAKIKIIYFGEAHDNCPMSLTHAAIHNIVFRQLTVDLPQMPPSPPSNFGNRG